MEVTIDWGTLGSEEEFFEVFLAQVKAPVWHGHNLNALGDSVITGDVNMIEPPYTIHNKNIRGIRPELKEFQEKVLEIFKEAQEAGREIDVRCQ